MRETSTATAGTAWGRAPLAVASRCSREVLLCQQPCQHPRQQRQRHGKGHGQAKPTVCAATSAAASGRDGWHMIWELSSCWRPATPAPLPSTCLLPCLLLLPTGLTVPEHLNMPSQWCRVEELQPSPAHLKKASAAVPEEVALLRNQTIEWFQEQAASWPVGGGTSQRAGRARCMQAFPFLSLPSLPAFPLHPRCHTFPHAPANLLLWWPWWQLWCWGTGLPCTRLLSHSWHASQGQPTGSAHRLRPAPTPPGTCPLPASLPGASSLAHIVGTPHYVHDWPSAVHLPEGHKGLGPGGCWGQAGAVQH